MSSDENQENIEELSKLREHALECITKYNRISKKVQFPTRLGLAESSIYEGTMEEWDEEEDSKPEDLDNYVYGSDTCYMWVDSPDSDGWFPSSFCFW